MKLKTVRIVLYTTIVILLLVSILISLYGSGYLLLYVTVLGPIIGVIVSSLIALEIWRLRLQDKYVKKHLDALKDQCIKPLKAVISDKFGYFSFNEKPLEVTGLESLYKGLFHWYDKKSIDGNMDNGLSMSRLFNDMDNHKITMGLPEYFRRIKNLISENYPIFLNNEINFYKKIDEDKEFEKMIRECLAEEDRETEQELSERGITLEPEPERDPFDEYAQQEADEAWKQKRDRLAKPFIHAIFLIAIGEGENTTMWPNLYEIIVKHNRVKQVESFANRYRSCDEIKNIITAKEAVEKMVHETIERINYVLDEVVTLDDKCKIIKENLKNY